MAVDLGLIGVGGVDALLVIEADRRGRAAERGHEADSDVLGAGRGRRRTTTRRMQPGRVRIFSWWSPSNVKAEVARLRAFREADVRRRARFARFATARDRDDFTG